MGEFYFQGLRTIKILIRKMKKPISHFCKNTLISLEKKFCVLDKERLLSSKFKGRT